MVDKNTWILIQARSTSTRFQNKAVAHMDNCPLILHTYDICASVNKTAIIIPTGDHLKGYLESTKLNIPVIEGPLNDVIGRYHQAAKRLFADYIVRITADCPLIPRSTLHVMIEEMENKELEFLTNLPTVDGYDIEIMSMRVLDYINANSPVTDREHVTDWFKKHQKGFLIHRWIEPYMRQWFPKMSVDTPEYRKDLKKYINQYQALQDNDRFRRF